MTCTSLRSGIASSGVLYNPHIPPAMAKIVRMMIRNLLRALASMTLSSSAGGGDAGCAEEVVSISLPRFQCALNLRFGINQEIRTAHHAVALFEPRFHGVVRAVFAGKLDKPRLEVAVALIHENVVLLTGRHYGPERHRQSLAEIQFEV